MMFTPVPTFAINDDKYPDRAQTFAQLQLPFYCINCQRKRPTAYLTPNFGPFCKECLDELDKLQEVRRQLGAALSDLLHG